jgi:hypothetical protein
VVIASKIRWEADAFVRTLRCFKIGNEDFPRLPIKKYLASPAKREFHQVLPLRSRITIEFIRTLERFEFRKH